MTRCKCCGGRLDLAVEKGDYKSCPKCSQKAGVHIFMQRRSLDGLKKE